LLASLSQTYILEDLMLVVPSALTPPSSTTTKAFQNAIRALAPSLRRLVLTTREEAVTTPSYYPCHYLSHPLKQILEAGMLESLEVCGFQILGKEFEPSISANAPLRQYRQTAPAHERSLAT
jgi:hypothetical protein